MLAKLATVLQEIWSLSTHQGLEDPCSIFVTPLCAVAIHQDYCSVVWHSCASGVIQTERPHGENAVVIMMPLCAKLGMLAHLEIHTDTGPMSCTLYIQIPVQCHAPYTYRYQSNVMHPIHTDTSPMSCTLYIQIPVQCHAPYTYRYQSNVMHPIHTDTSPMSCTLYTGPVQYLHMTFSLV